MSIVTECPSCGTKFRVTPVQLQAQHGMVRCGRCAQVFDGFKTLATLPEAAMPVAPVATPSASEAVTSLTPEPAVTPVAAPEPVREEPVAASAPSPTAVEEPPAVAAATVISQEPRITSPSYDTTPPRRRRTGWAIGVALMLSGLAAQGAYFYRSDIAANMPEARPHLNKMCELLHCTVALPQRPRQISIEASDMQATDPANPGLIALTATLRNHATSALGYPALDVVLTNTKEHTVARRVFMPSDYLPAGKDARSGIAANAEVTVRLDLETGDLGAAGFRLDLIAAPAR
ncbi:MAG: family finger-like protein [Betaproteobacteria bacterium]|nr:family finger-like protein [Betaproteobacteria bacterium]